MKLSLINQIKFYLLTKFNSYLLATQRQNIISSLGFVGKKISLQMPIQISGGSSIKIGENVSIAAYVHMWGQGGIEIGDRVMIASHSSITSITHDYQQKDMYKTVIKEKITIGDDVWIGANSVILPGIKIGKGAVIGAGSVVTKNVKPYSIVIGCPARHYKFRTIKNQLKDIVIHGS